MSAYGKAPPQLQSYDAGRSYPDNAFPYAAPTYGTQPPGPTSTTAPVYQSAPQLTPMTFPPNQVRAPYDDQTGPYLSVGTPTPEITSYAPHRGTRDTKFDVYITSLYELMTQDSAPHFSVMFGQSKCHASLRKVDQQGAVCSYSITTSIPSHSATAWTSSVVPISLWMESEDGDVIGKQEVGHFTFLDGQNDTNASQENSRKRKLFSDSTDLARSPSKRSSIQQLRPKEEYSTYGYGQGEGTSSYSSYLQPSNTYANLTSQYSRSVGPYPGQQQSRHINYGYQTSATASPPTLKAQSPQTGNWPTYSSNSMARSPGVQSSLGVSRPALSTLSAPQVAPVLIRTSTLQQQPSPATTPRGNAPAHFNPYSLGMYMNKVKLEITGNLDDMIAGWSEEEWESRRRLVHFRSSQSGSTLTLTFQPVSPENRPSEGIVISCIYWEEKNECFVTSVDTIVLLEKLLCPSDAKFTVEEKNRIRRNLEGFRPLTVSKGKQDSEEFFKVIMAFPAPKPRRIEKDVKVFQWKDLEAAVKKIVGKYMKSASPASTVSTSVTPVSSTGYVTESSSTGLSYLSDYHGGASPRSISNSTTSTYTSTIPARVLSPHDHKSMALQGGPPDLRIAINHNPHDTSSQWQGGHHHLQPQSYQPLANHGLTNHSTRGSWDMYIENGQTNAGGNSAPSQNSNIHYPNPRNVADPAATGTDSRMARHLPLQQQHPQSQQMPHT